MLLCAVFAAFYAQKHHYRVFFLYFFMTDTNKASVAIVILNWNGVAHLKQFLPSVLRTSYPNHQLWVIDNGSTDGSVAFLQQNYGEKIKLITLTQNLGYAGGYQAGLTQIASDYYVLLNSDVQTPENWLSELMAFAQLHPLLAAAQPQILSHAQPTHFEYAGAAGGLIDALAYPFCQGRIFAHTEPNTNQYTEAKQIFWASGACMLLKTEAFWQVGGLDPAFFAHMEEIDLCWRLQNANHQIWYCPTAQVEHLGGGTLQYGSTRKTYLNFRNSLIAIYKNTPLWQGILLISIRVFVLDPIAALQMLLNNQRKHAAVIFKAHIDFIKNLKAHSLSRRKTPQKTSLWKLQGVAHKSIVFSYFVLNKKTVLPPDASGIKCL